MTKPARPSRYGQMNRSFSKQINAKAKCNTCGKEWSDGSVLAIASIHARSAKRHRVVRSVGRWCDEILSIRCFRFLR
jgi:hypothetical protein